MIEQVHPLITIGDAWCVYDYLSSGGWGSEFKKTREFSDKIREFLGVGYASLCPNGTLGLYIALHAAGVGSGCRVAVPNYTMIATANAVVMAGAEPVFVDIREEDLCMDPQELEKMDDIDAVIYVEINGRGGDIEKVVSLCERKHWVLIEDACQAFGSGRQKKYGSYGDMGVFSFSPHKIITTGQGGAVITNNKELYTKIEKLRDFGRVSPGIDEHDELGFNFKFTDMQACLGLSQLNTIESRIVSKKNIYRMYQEYLPKCDNYCIGTSSGFSESEVPWFVELFVRCPEIIGALRHNLELNGIKTRPCYPPLYAQSIYSRAAGKQVADFVRRGVWLPSSLDLKECDVVAICSAIRDFWRCYEVAPGLRQ